MGGTDICSLHGFNAAIVLLPPVICFIVHGLHAHRCFNQLAPRKRSTLVRRCKIKFALITQRSPESNPDRKYQQAPQSLLPLHMFSAYVGVGGWRDKVKTFCFSTMVTSYLTLVHTISLTTITPVRSIWSWSRTSMYCNILSLCSYIPTYSKSPYMNKRS